MDTGTPSAIASRSVPVPPRWLALVPTSLALLLYVVTCSPTINFTDSGELTTVAWTLGIAHPPGYPLYTLLSSAWIRLPLGDNPAWRLNLAYEQDTCNFRTRKLPIIVTKAWLRALPR